jgi:hypothetical protein
MRCSILNTQRRLNRLTAFDAETRLAGGQIRPAVGAKTWHELFRHTDYYTPYRVKVTITRRAPPESLAASAA